MCVLNLVDFFTLFSWFISWEIIKLSFNLIDWLISIRYYLLCLLLGTFLLQGLTLRFDWLIELIGWLIDLYKILYTLSVTRNILAAATPYFHAMFTSGLMESEERQYRGQDRRKARQKLVLQGLEHHTLEVHSSDVQNSVRGLFNLFSYIMIPCN